jgi:hypothetical protein
MGYKIKTIIDPIHAKFKKPNFFHHHQRLKNLGKPFTFNGRNQKNLFIFC